VVARVLARIVIILPGIPLESLFVVHLLLGLRRARSADVRIERGQRHGVAAAILHHELVLPHQHHLLLLEHLHFWATHRLTWVVAIEQASLHQLMHVVPHLLIHR
jgi:hypothetical protein